MIKITKQSHPKVFEAFHNIDYDVGGFLVIAPSSGYDVPDRLAEEVVAAERSLAKLSEDDFEAFTIGDQDEADAMLSRDPDLELAQHLLAEFFVNFATSECPKCRSKA